MNIFYYLIESNTYLLVFYAFYRIALKNETFYTLNRFYLLITSLFSFLLPGIQLSALNATGPEPISAATQQSLLTETPFYIGMAIYVLVASIFLIRLGVKLYSILFLIRKGKIKQRDGFRQVDIRGQELPFSFLNYVFIDPDMPKIDTIIRHEKVHISQQHTTDILFFEFLQVMNWFNPFIFLIKSDIKILHEYIADEKTAAESSPADYALFLINHSYGIESHTLSNGMFSKNTLKNRLLMLNRKRSGQKARLKYILVLLLLPLMLCVSALSFTKTHGIIDIMPLKVNKIKPEGDSHVYQADIIKKLDLKGKINLTPSSPPRAAGQTKYSQAVLMSVAKPAEETQSAIPAVEDKMQLSATIDSIVPILREVLLSSSPSVKLQLKRLSEERKIAILTVPQPQNQSVHIIPVRQVSGIVTDSADLGISGATVTLISKTDTLKTRTNQAGLFFFKNVKAWEFTLSVNSLGYRTYVKIGKYNDATVRLTMDPIVLRTSPEMLREVVINGTPSITYKTDTVEYKASDYVVREGAGVDELLKKMEGMEVANDGTLTYNGTEVKKARLNGKDFLGGDVVATTKNLPAEIVEKIQIVDDYGDQAARTGIKDKEPSKLLNITTNADRSLGYLARLAGGAGNNERYEGNLNGTKINANKNFTLSGIISNTINGVGGNVLDGNGSGFAPSPGESNSGDSGGNTKKRGAAFTYRDQWGAKTQVNMNYSYSLTDINSVSNSIAQDFSTNGITNSINEQNGYGNSKTHKFSFDLENDLDSADYLKITPTLSYTLDLNNNQSSAFLSGLIHQDQIGIHSNLNQTPNYGLTVFYQHVYPKRGKNYSIQLSGSNKDNEQEQDKNTTLTYFDPVTDALLKDSVVHRLIERDHLTKNYRASFTYSNPLASGSVLQFNSEINYNGYNNQTTTNDFNQTGSVAIDSLSNTFGYSLTQAKVGLSYNYQKRKSNITVGAYVVPVTLSGTNSSPGASVNRTSFHIVPVFNFRYAWSLQQTFSMYYSGSASEPLFEQIQPLRDVSNPQNPVVGNPELKVAFNHSLSAYYNNYYPNSRLRINGNMNTTYYDNRVITDIVQISDSYNSLKYEKRFLNTNGTYHVSANYGLTKQLSDRRYNLALTGNIDHRQNAGMSNHVKNISKQWTFQEKFALRANPNENMEVNPSVAYTFSRNDNSLPTAFDSKTNVLTFRIDGAAYFKKSWAVGYDLNKNFVHGINSNISNDPFIMDMYLQKEFFKNKSARLRLQAFDLFNQNKFLNRSITETNITDTRSNSLSRYFMIHLNVNLQRFKGTPTRNGETMKRHNDGSFIYN